MINITGGEDLTLFEVDEIVNKIKRAKTDSFSIPNEEQKLKDRPEAENLLGIYSSLTNSTLQNSVKNFSGKNFSDFKENLSEILISLQPS